MVFAIIIILVALGSGGCGWMSQDDVTITVDHRESKGDSGNYLIWATNGEVYSDVDSIPFWKFNSSDVFGQLKEGGTYKVHVAGWRIHVLSLYRNIIEVKEVIAAPTSGVSDKSLQSQPAISSPAGFCPKCGSPVGADYNFCGKCGTKLK